eukprot:CAMPEP_0114235102 /NCGR_PEP_ID=MMETSP0058-20121206/6064_1 /TAXON_ID=36894 /ORGANISM="Pyramimonas parkeae, CCMP726" /LENGTH=450 /DNA_ID=CAMNT_0001346827 /DNA_START=233 /DNA_END=1585 /DNA_ORIENTATION=+
MAAIQHTSSVLGAIDPPLLPHSVFFSFAVSVYDNRKRKIYQRILRMDFSRQRIEVCDKEKPWKSFNFHQIAGFMLSEMTTNTLAIIFTGLIPRDALDWQLQFQNKIETTLAEYLFRNAKQQTHINNVVACESHRRLAPCMANQILFAGDLRRSRELRYAMVTQGKLFVFKGSSAKVCKDVARARLRTVVSLVGATVQPYGLTFKISSPGFVKTLEFGLDTDAQFQLAVSALRHACKLDLAAHEGPDDEATEKAKRALETTFEDHYSVNLMEMARTALQNHLSVGEQDEGAGRGDEPGGGAGREAEEEAGCESGAGAEGEATDQPLQQQYDKFVAYFPDVPQPEVLTLMQEFERYDVDNHGHLDESQGMQLLSQWYVDMSDEERRGILMDMISSGGGTTHLSFLVWACVYFSMPVADVLDNEDETSSRASSDCRTSRDYHEHGRENTHDHP